MKIWFSGRGSQITLSPQEIDEISREISRDFSPDLTTYLPELVLLPVDPLHLYAYWNLGEHKEKHSSGSASDSQLILRVYWRPDQHMDITKTKLWFDVPIAGHRDQKKIPLPIDKTTYSAAIGIRDSNNRFDVWAYSNTIEVPRGNAAPLVRRQGAVETRSDTPDPAPNPTRVETSGSHLSGDDSGGLGSQQDLIRYENLYVEAVLNSHLMDALPERSFDISLIANQKSSKKSHYVSSNASGRTNNC